MNEPQVWTIIWVLAAALFGMMTLMSTMCTRVIRSEIGRIEGMINGLEGKFDGKFEAIEAKFEIIEVKFDAIDRRFDAVDARFDNLDRDVQYLIKREADR
ncbi:MAG: hypothetical protein WAS05_08115 [Candidatus Nanopelagicales bacterium]